MKYAGHERNIEYLPHVVNNFMGRRGYAAYYYDQFAINWLVFAPESLTGQPYQDLKANLIERGLINPVIVELSDAFRVVVGHNRCRAWQEIGHETIRAVILVDRERPLPPGGRRLRYFFADMQLLHPGDETWTQSLWACRVR